MAHLGNGVEYGLHCLLWLVDAQGRPASSRDLADLQQVSPSFLAKIFSKLEKAGIVLSSEGIRGGYQLARQPGEITVLDVVDAIEGDKPLFDCQEIRGRCALFGDNAPGWATDGVCAIHAVMLRAEKRMREELAATSMADLAGVLAGKMPADMPDQVRTWLSGRVSDRSRGAPDAPARRRSRRSSPMLAP
jgi:Rrf2 family protein